MRFVILRKSDATMESCAPVTPELIEAMRRYDDEMRKAGVLIAVERLQPTAKGARVHLSGGKYTVTDGPFSETKELIAGVTMIEVASREEAIAWIKRCPTLQSGNIEAEFEIREVLDC
ncbi:MAG TPA: YciI family protein [Pseudacidobacterium sp.]|nr:YciI family protein [Pseudacidobacterium sp.]